MIDQIQTQVDYARTQPWFSVWINALHSCSSEYTGYSIVDLIYWAETDEGQTFWQRIEDRLRAIPNFKRLDDLELADLKPYLPDYPEIFL